MINLSFFDQSISGPASAEMDLRVIFHKMTFSAVVIYRYLVITWQSTRPNKAIIIDDPEASQTSIGTYQEIQQFITVFSTSEYDVLQ